MKVHGRVLYWSMDVSLEPGPGIMWRVEDSKIQKEPSQKLVYGKFS